MTIYLSSAPGSARFHLSPLCRRVGGDWRTLPIGFALDFGLICCSHCARRAYNGYLWPDASHTSNRTRHPTHPSYA